MATNLIKKEDILTFDKACKRAENDATNRIRERAFMLLNNMGHEFFKDPVYGERWSKLLNATHAFMKDVLTIHSKSTDYERFRLEPLGGRSEHFDIRATVYYEADNSSFNFEFKFNSMPQFAQFYTTDRYITDAPTLPEFWYDNGWVDKMIDIYPKPHTFLKPPRDEYLRGAHVTLGATSPPSFFKQFYDFDHSTDTSISKGLYSQRAKLVKEGISDYLTQYAAKIDIQKLCSKLSETQKEKVYGIWNPKKQAFTLLEYTKEEMNPTEFLRINNKNTIVLKAGNSEMHLLLRWKNTLGVSTAAWQISMKKPKQVKPKKE